MQISQATLSLLPSLLCLIIILTPTMVDAQPSICFIPAYNASFSNSLAISPFGSFSIRVSGGYYGFASNGFSGACLNTTVSSEGYSYVEETFRIKGSFKTSIALKIEEGSNFNFTGVLLILSDASTYRITLGLDDSLKLIVYRPDRKNEGVSFERGKWYNLTISLDALTDTLTILRNSTQAISPLSTGVKTYSVEHAYFQIGIINTGSASGVKAYFDEFSTLVSPIIFTDRPVYASSSSVPVKITVDQFLTSPLDITIIHPNGSVLLRSRITSVNSTGGFDYSTSLRNPSSGTYTLRVNSSSCSVNYHFGVWDLTRIWERKSTIRVKAGGLMPGSFATIYVRNSTHLVFSQRLDSNYRGEFDQQVNVPVNIQLGVLTAYLEYDEVFDFKNRGGFTDSLQITVVKAVLNVTVTTDAVTYERVKPINIRVYVKYKDGSSLPYNGIVKLSMFYEGVKKMEMFIDYTYDGYWSKTILTRPSDQTGSYLIKVEASDRYENSGAGNKTITLTVAKLNIALRNQLEGSYARSTKINISVSVTYPDGTLVESGRVTFEMLRDQYRKGPFSFTNTGLGYWDVSRSIPISEQTGNWTLIITAMDDAGNSGDLSLKISVVLAELNIKILSPSSNVFSRTQTISVNAVVKYPSQEALSQEYGVVEAFLVHTNNSPVSSDSLYFSIVGWSGNISIPKHVPLGQYFLNVSARDDYGNLGFKTISIEVEKATLSIAMEGLRDVYQIGFDNVPFKALIKYPDDSTMDEGNVIVSIICGSMSNMVELVYEDENGKWVGQYYLLLAHPTGDCIMCINATDPYGNTGFKEVIFRVSNLHVILIIISVTITLGVSVSLLLIRRRRPRIPMAPVEDELYG